MNMVSTSLPWLSHRHELGSNAQYAKDLMFSRSKGQGDHNLFLMTVLVPVGAQCS